MKAKKDTKKFGAPVPLRALKKNYKQEIFRSYIDIRSFCSESIGIENKKKTVKRRIVYKYSCAYMNARMAA